MERRETTQAVKRRARELGFDRVGIAAAQRPPHADVFLGWLDAGFHGSMEYLRRGAGRRLDPQKVLPGAKTVVCVAMNYFTKDVFPQGKGDRHRRSGASPLFEPVPVSGRVSRYAWGDDYHEVLGAKVARLSDYLRNEIGWAAGMDVAAKGYVDTGPVLEREVAALAGLGWIGKNSCIIHPEQGSYFFLGEVITTLELEPDAPMSDHCGTCTLCLQACPTGALVAPYRLDARKCISYLTIEHRREIEESLQPGMGAWIYGCDICQEACPWNAGARPTGERRFEPREGFERPDLEAWSRMTEAEYRARFKGSAMKRTKLEGLMRNVGIALKNAGER